ncbi:hypothetical protein QBK99_14490 [Corticibacterium sp. UT-5YL-CI-8]|nr:hypothetical protein [Tianweitania sp. UT-5YL-CI-8]
MSSIFRFRDTVEDGLHEQVARLSKEMASLQKILSRQGARAAAQTRDGASEIYDELASRLQDAMPVIRKQARVAQRTARDNPVATAIIGVAVAGLVLSLLSRRS